MNQNYLSVGTSLFITFAFGCLSFLSYDDEMDILSYIPFVGLLAGVILTIRAAILDHKLCKKERMQDDFARSIKYDSRMGDSDLMLYIDNSQRRVLMFSSSLGKGVKDKITDFAFSEAVRARSFYAIYDAEDNWLACVSCDGEKFTKYIYNINELLKNRGIEQRNPNKPSLMVCGDYVLLSDDENEYLAVAGASSIHILPYAKIRSVVYEENWRDVFSKSAGGEVVGSMLSDGEENRIDKTGAFKVQRMAIKILTQDAVAPSIMLNLMDGKSPRNTSNYLQNIQYEKLLTEAKAFTEKLSSIIDRAGEKEPF